MLHFNQNVCKKDLFSVTEALKNNIFYSLNCVKVASVVSFDSSSLIACCRVKNKRLMGLKDDGNQELADYPLIYAKTYFLGHGEIGITHPVTEGMEGILLFNDRELETWYITGKAGNLAYDRTHDLSDAIFICGLCSQPNLDLVQYLENCINIYYGATNIQVFNNKIDVSTTTTNLVSNINQTGNSVITGTLTVDGISDTTGASGTFLSDDNKLVTVVNGIVKSIQAQ